jgi:tetratricopeptide (TPR) repeat protein
MKTFSTVVPRLFVAIAIFLVVNGWVQDGEAAVTAKSLKSMKIEKIDSFRGMARAIGGLRAGVERVTDEKDNLFDLQKQIIATSGDCISRVVALQQGRGKNGTASKKNAKNLLTDIRRILNIILKHNLAIIANLQEHHLDKMEDPYTFFNSPAWQEPHTIASLASYWIGWDGFYLSTFHKNNTPEKREVLEEAVEAFSRAFIDFKEDAVITKSLFGRALCYKQQGAYERAAHDLKNVKRKIGKDDPLFLRCVYEEALISYQTGNFGPALRILDNIQDDMPSHKITPQLMDGFNRLRAKILLSTLEKEKPAKQPGTPKTDDKFLAKFTRIKKLAESNQYLVGEFYRYVQTNAGHLMHLSYEQLGPIGIVAMGDYHFDHHRMNDALRHYLYLNTNSKSVPKEFHDDILFRIGAIYCQKKKWHKALPFLELFAKKFPKSKVISQAAHLYYVAAANLYMTHSNSETHKKLIAATKLFLERCPDCPDQSEARFQLGKYYQSIGKNQKAMGEYALVKEDSPNFRLSRYHLIEAKVTALSHFAEKKMSDSKAALTLFKEGKKYLKEYAAAKGGKKGTEAQMAAKIQILSARLHLYGPDSSYKEGLQALEGFERRFPKEVKLQMAATELRLHFYHQHKRLSEAKNELARFLTETVVDTDWYVFVQELGNKFYRQMRTLQQESDTELFEHFTFMPLAVYNRLLEVCSANSTYEKDADTIRLRIGDIYMSANRFSDARKLYQTILKENPKSANAVYNLGLIYEKAEMWKEALASWRRFSDGAKAGTYHWYEARYRTATAFVALGKKDKACTILKMTLVLHPDLGDEELTRKFQNLKADICTGE